LGSRALAERRQFSKNARPPNRRKSRSVSMHSLLRTKLNLSIRRRKDLLMHAYRDCTINSMSFRKNKIATTNLMWKVNDVHLLKNESKKVKRRLPRRRLPKRVERRMERRVERRE